MEPGKSNNKNKDNEQIRKRMSKREHENSLMIEPTQSERETQSMGLVPYRRPLFRKAVAAL